MVSEHRSAIRFTNRHVTLRMWLWHPKVEVIALRARTALAGGVELESVLISGPNREYNTLAALARGLRLTKRLTQGEAAVLCGLTTNDIRAIEAGRIGANFCYDYIYAIAHRRKRKSKRTTGGKRRAGNLKI